MNDSPGCSTVQLLRRQTELILASLNIPRRDRFAHFSQLVPNRRFDGSISTTVDNVLTESFFRAAGIRHEFLGIAYAGWNVVRINRPEHDGFSDPTFIVDLGYLV